MGQRNFVSADMKPDINQKIQPNQTNLTNLTNLTNPISKLEISPNSAFEPCIRIRHKSIGSDQSNQSIEPKKSTRRFILNKDLAKKQIEEKNLTTLNTKSNISFESDDLYYSEYEHSNNIIASAKNSTRNNFLETFLFAYNNHLPLKIRPDDIHLALQLIFCTTITINAEKLRSLFVSHQGKKELAIHLNSFDSKIMFELFKKEIRSNLSNPSFVEKFVSDYSTTNSIISNASGSLLMNSLKEYFSYNMYLSCGIPELIMEGSESDWQKLNDFYVYMKDLFNSNSNISELKPWFDNFDHLMQMFIELSNMESADLSNTSYAKLWSRVITYTPYGSGGDQLLGGWIRLFFPYDTSKKLVHTALNPLKCLDTTTEYGASQKSSATDYYGEQNMISNFYGSSGEESIPTSVQKTKLKIVLENIYEFKSDLISGFYPPHINMQNQTDQTDPFVEFNIGTLICSDIDIRDEKQKDEYIALGVKEGNYGLKIPYCLKKETMDILKLLNANCCSYYYSEKCISMLKESKAKYEQMGIFVDPKTKHIMIPRKYGKILVYTFVSKTDPSISVTKKIRRPISKQFDLDVSDIRSTFEYTTRSSYMNIKEYMGPDYIKDEYDIDIGEYPSSLYSITITNLD
jgi:Domain of unknown function (DUF4419)